MKQEGRDWRITKTFIISETKRATQQTASTLRKHDDDIKQGMSRITYQFLLLSGRRMETLSEAGLKKKNSSTDSCWIGVFSHCEKFCAVSIGFWCRKTWRRLKSFELDSLLIHEWSISKGWKFTLCFNYDCSSNRRVLKSNEVPRKYFSVTKRCRIFCCDDSNENYGTKAQ